MGKRDKSGYEKFEKRVKEILGKDFDRGVSEDTLVKYRQYLEGHLKMPCILTGIEDFRWEEFYVFGPRSKKEYEELKKTQPSYTDQYELIGFEDELGGIEEGLMVKVKRIKDRRRFVLPLGELKAVDKKSDNYQLVNDYAVWIVNY